MTPAYFVARSIMVIWRTTCIAIDARGVGGTVVSATRTYLTTLLRMRRPIYQPSITHGQLVLPAFTTDP
jgi:hypothetical protein